MSRQKAHQRSDLAYFRWLALKMGVPFGWGMGVVIGIGSVATLGWGRGLGLAAIGGLASGALFGLAAAFILGGLARSASRRVGAEPLDVHQHRVLQVDGDRDQVLRRVEAAMRSLPRAKAPDVDEAEGLVTMRTRASWRSSGEIVEARITQEAGSAFRVNIESRPRLATTLLDFGANAINADAIVSGLQQSG